MFLLKRSDNSGLRVCSSQLQIKSHSSIQKAMGASAWVAPEIPSPGADLQVLTKQFVHYKQPHLLLLQKPPGPTERSLSSLSFESTVPRLHTEFDTLRQRMRDDLRARLEALKARRERCIESPRFMGTVSRFRFRSSVYALLWAVHVRLAGWLKALRAARAVF